MNPLLLYYLLHHDEDDDYDYRFHDYESDMLGTLLATIIGIALGLGMCFIAGFIVVRFM